MVLTNTRWDLGSTANFVKKEHAQRRGFNHRNRRLAISPLKGKKSEMTAKVYLCTMRDMVGGVYTFMAY